jgi:2'-hydroxyisoflavone reductase
VPPANEDVTEIDNVTYGTLKVACENIVQQTYADRCAVLRPQIVVGPYDPSGRYTYWLKRSTMGGEMLAPGDGNDHVQFIDARDLGRFAATVIENDLSGPFNLAGHRQTWGEFIRLLGARDVIWIPAETIRSAGVTEFELPLFRSERGPHSGLMDVSNEKARTAGLSLTDSEVTLRDSRAWMEGREHTLALSPEREAELIGMFRTRSA